MQERRILIAEEIEFLADSLSDMFRKCDMVSLERKQYSSR